MANPNGAVSLGIAFLGLRGLGDDYRSVLWRHIRHIHDKHGDISLFEAEMRLHLIEQGPGGRTKVLTLVRVSLVQRGIVRQQVLLDLHAVRSAQVNVKVGVVTGLGVGMNAKESQNCARFALGSSTGLRRAGGPFRLRGRIDSPIPCSIGAIITSSCTARSPDIRSPWRGWRGYEPFLWARHRPPFYSRPLLPLMAFGRSDFSSYHQDLAHREPSQFLSIQIQQQHAERKIGTQKQSR